MTTITANGTAHTIPYDNSGNPSNWYNGSKSYSGMTWQNGRQLTQLTTGGKTSKYTYDADGIRSTKDINGTKHEYRTLNGKVVWEKIGEGTSAKIMVFSYDAQGRPFGFKFSKNNGTKFTNYFYALNQQGDVVKIFRPVAVKDADGNVTGYTEKTYATYTYDAWGKLTGILDSGGNNLINKQTTSTALANLNPLRYRGYYYDNETGFYYLQSRYYDPAVRRFINADTYASTDSSDAIACNMFAYCANNPIVNADPSGEFLITTLILIGAGIIGGGVAVYTGYKAREAGCDWGDTLFYAIGSGLCTFAAVYTLGTTAYGVYANYCAINAITPVTEVGNSTSTMDQLQNCADTANLRVAGNGPVVGTQKHAVFANEVNALGNSNLRTEVSYLNGAEVPYATKGSVRFDVLEYNSAGLPMCAYDLKTGAAVLTAARAAQMQQISGLNIPIHMIK